MNLPNRGRAPYVVSAGCHINDVMNHFKLSCAVIIVSAGCHINDVMNKNKKMI